MTSVTCYSTAPLIATAQGEGYLSFIELRNIAMLFCCSEALVSKKESRLPEDEQPLISSAPEHPRRHQQRNKRRSPGPYDNNRPKSLKPFSPNHISGLDSDAQLSPGAYNVKMWLANHPDTRDLEHHEKTNIHQKSRSWNSANSGVMSRRSVMVQVFQRDNLLKNDLIPLEEGENTEICISYLRQSKDHQASTRFRTFQITPDSSPFDEFKRQFGKGIRLYCHNGQTVQLKKSTILATYYGTRTTPTWTEMKDENKWERVFDFSTLKGNSIKGNVQNSDSYNHRTACVENTVRLTVGCKAKTSIYDTNFHIKLSFIVH